MVSNDRTVEYRIVFSLSLSQMSSGWRETANRVMLALNVGRLQIAVVAADRVIPITSES